MNSFGTDRKRSPWLEAARAAARALLTASCAVALTAPALADDEEMEDEEEGRLEARAEATLGTRLYLIDSPYDNDYLGGYWDQYRQTRKKNNDPPFFIDLFHTDIGLARDDDTYLLRFESWSPNYGNDRAEIEGRYRGLDFDANYRRYRSEELRFFPEGTLQNQNNPPSPIFPYGTHYTPDATEQELRNSNRRFFLRRTGIDGELRFRPEGFGLDVPVLSQASLRSAFERRKGWRQDSFLLDPAELAPRNRRFRGNRRKVDQEVSNVGGGFVLSPGAGFVTDFDVFFETFREKADPVLFSDIAASDPSIPSPAGDTALRAFNFVPNTDRVSGSMRLAGDLGPVAVHGGAFVTHLRQTNKAPLQRSLGLDKQDLTTWSAHAGFEVPVMEVANLTGFVKMSERHNGLDASDFEAGRQIGPILRRRSEVEAEVELAARPAPGALVATGYRFDYVDRNFRYPTPPGVIEPSLALVENDSQKHTLYVRGRARLLRRAQVSGELGWEYAPQRDFPRDPTYTVYFDGRGSYTLPKPVPLTLTVFGGVRDGQGNGRVLTGESTQARKDLDRLQWRYGATATALPSSRTTLTLSFIQQRDEQDFPYLRTDATRTAGTGVTNFLPDPDRPHYKSDVKSVAVSGTRKLGGGFDTRAFTTVNWVRAWYSDSSNTSIALESASEIKSKILSAGGGLGWTAAEGLRFDVGYRFDDYIDRRDGDAPIDQDDRRHTFTAAVTVDLGLFSGNFKTTSR